MLGALTATEDCEAGKKLIRHLFPLSSTLEGYI